MGRLLRRYEAPKVALAPHSVPVASRSSSPTQIIFLFNSPSEYAPKTKTNKRFLIFFLLSRFEFSSLGTLLRLIKTIIFNLSLPFRSFALESYPSRGHSIASLPGQIGIRLLRFRENFYSKSGRFSRLSPAWRGSPTPPRPDL